MVKIRNIYGDEYKGKQGNAVYQKRYGKQIRRIREKKKKNKAPGQVEQQRRFKVGLAWYKGLSTVEKQGLEDWIKQNGINLTAQQYAIKTALDRGRATKEIWSEQTKDWTYISGWDAEGWLHRQKITITNSNSYDLVDFQVRLELNTDNVGANFDWSRHGADLRFYDANGTKLPYYVESWDEVNKVAVVWVKVQLIQAGGSTDIKMYYDNSEAASESNGDAVFEFFDDFEGTALDTSKWGTQVNINGVDVSNSVVTITGASANATDAYIQSINTITIAKIVIEYKARMYSNSYYCQFTFGALNRRTSFNPYRGTVIQDYHTRWYDGTELGEGSTGLGDVYAQFHTYKVEITGTTMKSYIDNYLLYSDTISYAEWTDNLMLFVRNQGSPYSKIQFDWVRVRKYADVEPSATFQAEEYGLTFTTVIIQVEHVVIQHSGMQNVYLLDENDTVIKSYENLSDLANAKLCTSVEYKNDTQKNIRKVIIESISGVLNSIYL